MSAENINIRVNVDNSQAQKNTDNLKQRVKELREQMALLAAAGKDNTEEYKRMAQEAGKLQDAIGDVSADIKNLANDNQTLAASLQGVGAGVAVFGALQGAAALFGVEDEKLLKTMQKIQAVQAILNSLNTIANALNKNSALMTALRTKSQASLNKELAKTTTEEAAGTAATTAFTAAEGAATTGAITLKGAVKSVGTAIKSVPVVGWILAAIAAITTLISLISDANEEEEKGVRLKERERQALDDIHAKHAQILNDILQQNYALRLQLQTMSRLSKDTVEYKDLLKNLADYTGLSADYIESLTDAQKEQLATVYGQLKAEEAHLDELNELADEYQKKWDEARKNQYSDDEDTRKQAIADLEWMANANSDYYKKTHENAENIQKANERIAKAQKEINKERQKELDWQKEQTEAEKNRTAAIKARNEAEKEHQRFIENSKKEIEELNNALYGQDEEEKLTEKYDRLLDLAIKYYGEESEEYAKVVELRAQSLEELKEKQAKADEELAKQRLEDERKFEDERLQVAENGIKTEMTTLEEGTVEWYQKKLDLDRHQEDTEKLELERKLQDGLISEELYLSEYDRLTAEHAKTRAEIEMEFNKRVADDYREKMMERVGYAETFVNAFSNMVEAAMEAELEAVGDNEAQQKEVRKKYAKAKWLSDISGIGVSTAKAIMEAWSSVAGLTPPLNLIMGGMLSAMIGAQGALQTAQATSAMTKALSYGKGGMINGRSHNEGGVDINAEGGEAIINKRSTAAFLPLLSAINEAGGGVPINSPAAKPSNAQVSATVDDATLTKIVKTVVAGTSAIPVVVTERDITDSQSERRTIVSRGRI